MENVGKRISIVVLTWSFCAMGAFGQETAAPPAARAGEEASAADWPTLHARSVEVLRTALAQEKEWVRVHAAESLLRNGMPDGVKEAFAPEVETAPPPHRIGVWRVMAQAQTTDRAREEYVARVRQVFLDPNAPDRTNAVETLAKLKDTQRPDELVRVAKEDTGVMGVCARWALANSGSSADRDLLMESIESPDEKVRGCAAYAIRFLPKIGFGAMSKMGDVLKKEPRDSTARSYFMSALFVHVPGRWKPDLRDGMVPFYIEKGNKDDKCEVAAAFAAAGDATDVPALEKLLGDPEADVRVAAADALLCIERRTGAKS